MTDVFPYRRAAHRPPVSSTGDAQVDQHVVALVAALSEAARELGVPGSPDLVHDVLVELARTTLAPVAHREVHPQGRDTRSNIKLTLRHTRDLRALFEYMAQYPGPKVTVFGSARTPVASPSYALVHETAGALAEHGYWVVNGGGPGAMAAATAGASESALQVAIALPFEPRHPDDGDTALVLDKYAVRKLGLIRDSVALVAAPGGFGTLDELYECITLMQTGKHPIMPVFLLEPAGFGLWEHVDTLHSALLERGMISAHDLDLTARVHSPAEVIDGIARFYSAFHSYVMVDHRAVGGMNVSYLVMRLQPGVELSDELRASLAEEFADIIPSGGIDVARLADKEIREVERGLADFPEICAADPALSRLATDDWEGLGTREERLGRIDFAFGVPLSNVEDVHDRLRLQMFAELPRIGFWFNNRSYARLGAMIRRINASARQPERSPDRSAPDLDR
ncbi:MAG: LOG family protein [Acidimicrobiia bacterium]